MTEAEPKRRTHRHGWWRRPLRAAAPVVWTVATVACGASGTPDAGSTPSSAPTASSAPATTMVDGAGRTFGPADDGTTVRLDVGDSAELILPATADDPTVTGEAVELVVLASLSDPGVREFEVRGRSPGISVVVGRSPAFDLTFVVE